MANLHTPVNMSSSSNYELDIVMRSDILKTNTDLVSDNAKTFLDL